MVVSCQYLNEFHFERLKLYHISFIEIIFSIRNKTIGSRAVDSLQTFNISLVCLSERGFFKIIIWHDIKLRSPFSSDRIFFKLFYGFFIMSSTRLTLIPGVKGLDLGELDKYKKYNFVKSTVRRTQLRVEGNSNQMKSKWFIAYYNYYNESNLNRIISSH